MFIFIAPVVQPSIKGLLGNTETNSGTGNITSQQLKRVEIVQSKEDAATTVAEKVGPSVVGIKSTSQNANEIFGVQSSDGEGSGIIISSDGYILTNYHVIADVVNDKTRSVRENAKLEVFLPSRINKPYSATVKGYDSKTDLAVIQINATNLPTIEFGDSNNVKVGEQVIAVGNPGGLEYMGSVTTGVVSGLNRTVELDAGKKMKLIQTDAAINPGNSGGALVNMKGQLIGVNAVKMVATGFEGLGFAIPVNEAKSISEQLLKNNYISRPYLGIQVDQRYTEEVAKQNNMPMGVYVADVEILGAAQKSGIKSQDIILKFNNKSVKSYDELEAEKNKFKPGDKVSVEVYRDGKTLTLDVVLGESK
jgi:serine protease Do